MSGLCLPGDRRSSNGRLVLGRGPLKMSIVRGQESRMDTDLHHVTLTGLLERDPITKVAQHGPRQVHCTLKLTEAGPAGQACKRYVSVEAYSQVAEQAGDLNAGDAVLVAGKLKCMSWTAQDGPKQSP